MNDTSTQHLMLLSQYEKRRDARDAAIAEAKARHKQELQDITDEYNIAWAEQPLDVLIEMERTKIFNLIQTDDRPLYEQYGVAEIANRSSIEIVDEPLAIRDLSLISPGLIERKIRKAKFNEFVKDDPENAARIAGWQVKITQTLTVKLNKDR